MLYPFFADDLFETIKGTIVHESSAWDILGLDFNFHRIKGVSCNDPRCSWNFEIVFESFLEI